MGSVWSVATAACALAPSYLALLAARIGIGVGQAGFGPAGVALLGATYPSERRATVLGVFQMGAPLGVVTGSVVGSLVAASWGWRAAFLVVALPGLVLALLTLRLRDYRSIPERSRGRATAATLLRAKSAIGAMLGGALLLVIVSTLYTWLPTHLERAYGLSPARAGVMASVVVLAGAVGTVTAGHVADRLARRDVRYRMLVPAVAAVATTATLGSAFGVVPPGPTQIVLILIGGATATTAIGPAAAVVLDVVAAGMRATAIGDMRHGAEPDGTRRWSCRDRRARRPVGSHRCARDRGRRGSNRRVRVLVGVAVLRPGPDACGARALPDADARPSGR